MTMGDSSTRTRSLLAAFAVTVSAVLAGVVIGIVADRTLGTDLSRFPRELPTPPGLEQSPAMRRLFVAQLAKELDLTDDQRVQVEALIEEESPRMRAAFDSAKSLMRHAVRSPQERLLKLLTPAQQEKFRRLVPPL